MTTKIQRWGNSLAIRLPKELADDAKLTDQSTVDLSFVDGKIVLSPAAVPVYALHELLEGITPDTVHPETDWGSPVGDESW